jgi:autotransporter translocation and assembly factor TamB
MAVAHVHGALNAPVADVAVLADNVHERNIPISANAFAHYERGTLHVNDATALALGSYATAQGDVRDLDRGTPALDMTANLHGAQVAPIAKALKLPLRYPDGEIDADLHATGVASAPHVDGTIRIPRGSLNGLNFRDANVAISGGTGGIAARNGTVTIGTTNVAFSGDANQAEQQIVLHAPHLNLADFDDYFDTADTLAGNGHVELTAHNSHTSVSANGDLEIANARYRRYDVGTVAANVQTHGRIMTTIGSVRSDHGSVALNGYLTLPPSDPLRDIRHRTAIALTGTVAGFDLAQWLPTAGITLPIAGTVDGTAHAGGTLAAPTFDANAALANGAVRGYHLTALTLAANGDTRSAHLTALHLAGPALTADASGTLGYGAHDPIAIALHAQSDDIGLLAKNLGVKVDTSGAFTTTLNASGTRTDPRLAQTLDVTNVRAGTYTIPRVHAELSADPHTLQLRTLEADLVKGRLLGEATLPIHRRRCGTRAVRRSAAERLETRRPDRRPHRRERNAERTAARRHDGPRGRQLFVESRALRIHEHACQAGSRAVAHRAERSACRRRRWRVRWCGQRHVRRSARSATHARDRRQPPGAERCDQRCEPVPRHDRRHAHRE